MLFKQRPGESVSSGFSAMFTNTVLVGIPIIQRAYGAGGAADGVLDHRLPCAGADHARHAGDGAGAPRRRAAAARRWSSPLLRIVAEPAALGRGARRSSATASHVKLPEPATAFLSHDVGGGAAGRRCSASAARSTNTSSPRAGRRRSVMSVLQAHHPSGHRLCADGADPARADRVRPLRRAARGHAGRHQRLCLCDLLRPRASTSPPTSS